MTMTKLGFPTQLRKLTTVENPEALRDYCHSLLPYFENDPSNYAKGRKRLWLFHNVDFRNSKLTKAFYDQRLYDFSQRVYPGCNIGLLTYSNDYSGISPHRDHTYALPKAVSVNLGRAIFSYGEPDLVDYLLSDGDITEFNCKVLHAVKPLSQHRFSLVFWRLNEAKGYHSLY